MASVKRQIIARVMDLLETLKQQDPGVRSVKRQRGFAVGNDPKPSIAVIVGAEGLASEDNAGLELEFPIFFKIDVEGKDPYDLADQFAETVQRQVESDRQLSGLANEMLYQGETPFSNEANSPEGGTLLHYLVRYRRQRAKPELSY
jgi:hypothetical protein